MAITVTTNSLITSTQLNLHNALKTIFAAAGYPTPYQEYTAASPYFLVYQFTNGTGTYATTYHVFSVTSTTLYNHMVYNTWDTNTRTGTGNYAAATTVGINNSTYTYLSFSDSSSLLGFALMYGTSFAFTHGFIKVQNKPSWFTEDIAASTLMLSGSTTTFSGMTWQTYSSIQKAGNVTYLDTIARRTELQQTNRLGNYSLVYPVLLSQGGTPIGLSPNYLAQGVAFSSAPGDRVIVSAGAEEWRSIGGGLWLREV